MNYVKIVYDMNVLHETFMLSSSQEYVRFGTAVDIFKSL